MTSARLAAIILFLALPLASCVAPGHRLNVDESFLKPDPQRKAWRKVAVLPFAGDPAFRQVAGEWLAFRLGKLGLFEVVDPVLAGIELDKDGVRFGGTDATVEEAEKAGRLLGADGVLLGYVGGGSPVRPGWPAAGARVVDMATGRIVGESVRPYPAWGGAREEAVMAAVDRVAEDLVPLLHAAAGRTWSPRPMRESTWPQDERDPGMQ